VTIEAKVIASSTNDNGTKITTFELEYPRFIHSELMTHRMFSRNSASSRAIPIEKMLSTIESNPAEPVHWGKNQAGMQAKEELDDLYKRCARTTWQTAMEASVRCSKALHDYGVHKQVANRITEPFQHMKVVMTSTELNNWFWLRDHQDAQPEIKELASKMQKALNNTVAFKLKPGEWHIPYVKTERIGGKVVYIDTNTDLEMTTEDALKVSASCCAQVSYRKSDTSVSKARDIYSKLIESEPCHASPVEHQAMCFDRTPIILRATSTWPEGITHVDRQGNLWSGNFRDFVQHRQLIQNNAKYG
jgi:hypothetical protein